MKPQDTLASHFRLDAPHVKALKKLGIVTVYNLLMHLPARYEDVSDIQSVGGLQKDQEAIVFGQLSGLKTRKAWTSKRPISEGYIEDGSAKIKIMWFNQPYMAKMYSDGMYVKLVGKVTGTEGKLYIANPEVEKLDSLPIDRHDSIFVKLARIDQIECHQRGHRLGHRGWQKRDVSLPREQHLPGGKVSQQRDRGALWRWQARADPRLGRAARRKCRAG